MKSLPAIGGHSCHHNLRARPHRRQEAISQAQLAARHRHLWLARLIRCGRGGNRRRGGLTGEHAETGIADGRLAR